MKIEILKQITPIIRLVKLFRGINSPLYRVEYYGTYNSFDKEEKAQKCFNKITKSQEVQKWKIKNLKNLI